VAISPGSKHAFSRGPASNKGSLLTPWIIWSRSPTKCPYQWVDLGAYDEPHLGAFNPGIVFTGCWFTSVQWKICGAGHCRAVKPDKVINLLMNKLLDYFDRRDPDSPLGPAFADEIIAAVGCSRPALPIHRAHSIRAGDVAELLSRYRHRESSNLVLAY
jgi:hypothetical protein